MHVAKLVLLLLLASPALAAETARADAALQKARGDLAKIEHLEHQLNRVTSRATRSVRATAAAARRLRSPPTAAAWRKPTTSFAK